MVCISLKEITDSLGELISLRTASHADAQDILAYNSEIISDDKHIPSSTELKLTFDYEKNWVNKLKHPNCVVVVAEHNSKIIGLLDFYSDQNGQFGMSLRNSYRGRGIGEALLDVLFQWDKEERH